MFWFGQRCTHIPHATHFSSSNTTRPASSISYANILQMSLHIAQPAPQPHARHLFASETASFFERPGLRRGRGADCWEAGASAGGLAFLFRARKGVSAKVVSGKWCLRKWCLFVFCRFFYVSPFQTQSSKNSKNISSRSSISRKEKSPNARRS